MSYNPAYILRVESERGNDIRIEILKKDFTGEPVYKSMGSAPILAIEQGDGAIKGSSLEFTIQADTEGELKEFYTVDNKLFKVHLYRNNQLYWQGYVLPELYSENYIDPPFDISVTATDQLATLKEITYVQEEGMFPLMEIIQYILLQTGLEIPVRQHVGITVGEDENSFLDNSYLYTEGFWGESCYDVLNNLLSSANLTLQMIAGEWVISSITDATTAYVNGSGQKEEIAHVVLGSMDSADVYPNGSLEMVNAPALKGVKLNYNYNLRKSLLKNADCTSKDSWMYTITDPIYLAYPGVIEQYGVKYRCYAWRLPQQNFERNTALQIWQDVAVGAGDSNMSYQVSVDYLFGPDAVLLLMAVVHEGVDGNTRRLTNKGWSLNADKAKYESYINVTGSASETMNQLSTVADASKYQKATVKFNLPSVAGTLRIGFINATTEGSDVSAEAEIFVSRVYLSYVDVAGKSSTTVVQANATQAQQEMLLSYGDAINAANEGKIVLNTLRDSSGAPHTAFNIWGRLSETQSLHKSTFSSYFLTMLQDASRYLGAKKMQLQGALMGQNVLHPLYLDSFSGRVFRLLQGSYDLVQDTISVTLEEVRDVNVSFKEEVFATDNTVSSAGSSSSGGGSGSGSGTVVSGGESLLALQQDGDVVVKNSRPLTGSEGRFDAQALPATKPASRSGNNTYIYSSSPEDLPEVDLAEMVAEQVAIREDFDALSGLLNDDTSGVIDTWNEVVDFLEGYKESDNLAFILSGMQSDFLTLQDNVGVIATDLSNLSVKVNDIDERVIALEELGLSLVVKDGKTYVRSEYNFCSDGGISAAGIGSGGGGGTSGGSNVTYRGELSSGMLLGTITIDGLANKIYGPSVVSQLANDMGYITSSVLVGYLPKSGGEISGPITWGSGKFGVDGSGEGIYMKWGEKTLHVTNDGLFYNWKYILHTGNYTNYCATKDHNHDDRYYTESEINTLLGGYYGKSEVNNLLNGKSDNGHKHVKADVTDFPTSMPASDVYAWAKAATKPTYTSAEVGLGNVQNYGTFSQTAFTTGVSYPVVNKGVMEIGDRVDFHSIEGGNDYEVSLRIKSGEVTARKIYFPAAEGTLALVSQVDTVNNSLNTHITAYDTFKRSIEGRLAELERMFEWDDTNIKAKANFFSVGGLSGAGNSPTQGGGSGTTVSFAQYVSSGIALGTLTINGVTTNNTIYAPNALSFYINDMGYITSSALAGYIPSSGGTISGNLTVGSANAGYNVAGGILSSGEIAGTHKIRVNAANNAGNYAFMRAQTYSDNRALLILGSCYGSVGPINDDAADYIAITTYKNTVGIGRFFEGSELYSYDKSSTKLAVAGNVNVTGTVTQGSDVRYKNIISDVIIDVSTIADAPIFNYTWKNGTDNRLHLGSTAQYWANTNLANGVITTTDATMWTMAYGEIALAGVVSVAKKVLNHEERIAALEKENKELKEKLYGVQ